MRARLYLPLIVFAALLAGCSPATVGTTHLGLSNFAPVTGEPHAIYRGAQPTPAGIATLKKEFHVNTVIDLRDDWQTWEPDACRAQKIDYQRVATSARVIDKQKIREFLETLRRAKAPVYVHCLAGRDRTGMELAIYRIVDQGWTRQAAIDELDRHGYNRFWFPGIERFLLTFDPEEFKSHPKPPAPQAAAAAAGPAQADATP
jgi:protein tyrosine/serine phosphatase